MGRIGERLDVNFVISTGDNFCDNGLEGVDDKAFEDSFTNVYTAKSLQKHWYSVLVNHDYRGDVLAQFSPILRKIDSRWLCFRSFVVNAEIADIFFVDTTAFVEQYWTNPKNRNYDWREVSPRNDLESVLRGSSAEWKIVVGHHAIRSVSHHGDTQVLVELMLPLLKAYNVDFYMNGHDHCLERTSDPDSPIQFLTSRGGSKVSRGEVKSNNQLKFFYEGQGFMSVQIIKTVAEIVYYDVYGSVWHK